MAKFDEINKIIVLAETTSAPKLNLALSALYASAKNTKHFYESLELCAYLNPYGYLKEFNTLKEKSLTSSE